MSIVTIRGLEKSYLKYKRFGSGTVLGNAHWLLATLYRLQRQGRIVALRDVNLEVKRGEIFCIVGPNGAGKTTLIKCLASLLLPDSGYIEIDGLNVVEEPLKVKGKVAVIGSGFWAGFDWSLSVEENLELFAIMFGYNRGEAKRRVGEVLKLVGLSDRAKDDPTALSSGQRQRLSLARGFMFETPIYLFDEPTVGLDPVGAREIRNYIKDELRRQGKTVVFTTHFMNEAEDLADRIAILDNGTITAIGTPGELKQEFVKGKIVEIRASKVYEDGIERLRKLEIINLDAFFHSGGAEVTIRILTREAEDVLGEVLGLIMGSGGLVSYANISEPTLEDLYRKVVGRDGIEEA